MKTEINSFNKRTIVQYITLTSLSNFARGAIMAIYVPFLLSCGLNLLQVGMVNFVFYSTLLICEIPTGAFADIFGRKSSFVISNLLIAVGGFMYSSSRTFWGFTASEAVLAIGSTFASGAFKAWLVNKLQHHGYTGSLNKIFSRTEIFSLIAGVIATLIGSQIADINIVLPFIWLGLISLITAIIAQLWLTEEYFVKKTFSIKLGFLAMKNTAVQSIEFGFKNKVVKFLLIISFIQIFAVQAINMQWSPYFLEYLQDKKFLGYLGAAVMLGVALGSFLSGKFLALVKNEKKALILCQMMIGIGTAIVTILPYPMGMTVFILHEIPRGMFKPLKEKFLQDNIPSHARATISSFEAVSPHFGGMIGLIVSGYVANKFGISSAWIMSGLLMLIMTAIVAKNGSKTDHGS